jgi:predicted alpha/beta superfamily hydrolase
MLALGLPFVCHSQEPAAGSGPIAIGERFQLRSEAIGETRSYFVHRPASYELGSARYPVLIVLDAEWDFQHASTTVDFLADENQIPAMLVVGIPNTDRGRDLIPQNGAENFLKFITTELIPKLDQDFRTQPYRILVGHSNGGLFGLYALIGAPGVFTGYVLASPVLGDDDRELPKTVGSFLETHEGAAASVYLTLANETDMLSVTWELSSYFQQLASRDSSSSFAFRQYPDENHGTILLPSLYDGLQFVFDGWEGPDAFALYEQGGLPAIEQYYTALSSRFGFAVPAPAQLLLAPAFPLYGQQRIDEAERVILRTLELYPNDTNALLTAGRLYFDKGDKPKAVEYLTKALLISPARRAIGVDYAALDLDPNEVVRAE